MSLFPFVLALSHASVFFFPLRDCHTFSFGLGAVGNFMLSSVLKRVIGELRPAPTLRKGANFSIYGMPSSHAMFTTFYLGYFYLFLLSRMPHRGTRYYILYEVTSAEPGIKILFMCSLETTLKSCFLAANTVITGLVIYGRVYLMYHTLEQVRNSSSH